ncbi:hypothetical protein ACP4OV_006674 [Aristida adscensionis]
MRAGSPPTSSPLPRLLPPPFVRTESVVFAPLRTLRLHFDLRGGFCSAAAWIRRAVRLRIESLGLSVTNGNRDAVMGAGSRILAPPEGHVRIADSTGRAVLELLENARKNLCSTVCAGKSKKQRTEGQVSETLDETFTCCIDSKRTSSFGALVALPCISGFLNGCKPYLSIGSTDLSGKWDGHLAAANALDGCNSMFPVAYGFFESECVDNWTWFMRQLNKAIGSARNLAICTDVCRGMESAVKTAFPDAEHRECIKHLMQNISNKFHGVSFLDLYAAAFVREPRKFEKYMNSIITACPDVVPWLQKYHSTVWMRSSFNKEVKCDYITNNLAERWKKWVEDLMDLPPIDLADALRVKIMTHFDKRRRVGEKLMVASFLP